MTAYNNYWYTFDNSSDFLSVLGGTYLKIKGDMYIGGTVQVDTDIPCRGKTRKVHDTPDDLSISINGYEFGISEFN